MSFFEVFLLSLALAADAFSVGAALGLRYRSPRQIFRIAFHFGLFQGLLAFLGALLGGTLLIHVESFDHWIAFALLALLGGRMIWSGLHETAERHAAVDLTRGWSLLGLSLAVSIDALAAGTTLPATGAPIGLAVATIGIVASLATLAAMRFAGSIAHRIGSRAEIVAGIVLIGLGVKIVLEHTGLFLPP